MSYTWKFFRAGGFDQVKLESGSDLANLDQLDQKLWVALACPTRGLEFDSRTLDLVDTDKDGRVRVPEVIAAAKWATSLLKNPDGLLKGSPALPLAAINDASPEGKQILASAKQILVNLGKKDETEITLDEVSDTAKIFAATNFNGDGIIPADAAGDEGTKKVIEEIMACCGVETDRSGKPGIGQAKADAFFADTQAFSDWWKQGEADKNILPLGEATSAASAAVKAVKVKVDDFFARCKLAAFDPRAVATLNRAESEYVALTAKDLTANASEVAGFPLAQIAAGKSLPLAAGVNPAWAAALGALQSAGVKPLLGDKMELTEADWLALQAKLAAFEAWSAGKLGASVEKLGIARVREILTGDAKVKISALIAQDKALEPEANAIAAVEKLIRFNRDLYTLCVNFVSFKNFYSRTIPAIFQAGRLYLDQRSCDLCLTVEDAAKHATMAGLAGAYLAYVDCVRKATGEKLNILAIFSQGDDDNLMIGRNGIFYDRKGNDYDATITKIVANPISVRQAFFAPYKKLARFIEEQVAKRAATADAAATANLQSAATSGPTPAATPNKIDTGTLAAIGLVLTTLMGALGVIFTKIFDIHPRWEIPLLFIGLLFAVSMPSVIMAWLQLRKRNLGPILDANGWAVNAKAKMNVPFGASLTQIATLPPGSQRDMVDPFAEKKSPWPKIIIVLVVLAVPGAAWYYGKLDKVLPPGANSISMFGGTNAPAFQSGGTNAPGWKALGTNAPAYQLYFPPVMPTNAPAAVTK
ncbi:MAG TPA: hypothetical protein VK742_07930 [Candidatus Sulfotelmatobacter sp.]|jgi:hypothetical protein|nr:hypothetical protein [Candidatus Sulfotelmatobacter sp.]